ncbi:MAG TPA: hypothetical protein VII50_07095 [Acidothermaceae bacterium]
MNRSGRQLLAVALLVTLAGCTRHGSQLGTVTGVARMYGGPLVHGKMADDGNPGPGITLTATHNGRPVASVVTGADGSYRFTLAAGSYVVTGCAGITVVVTAGHIDQQDIGCPIP